MERYGKRERERSSRSAELERLIRSGILGHALIDDVERQRRSLWLKLRAPATPRALPVAEAAPEASGTPAGAAGA